MAREEDPFELASAPASGEDRGTNFAAWALTTMLDGAEADERSDPNVLRGID
ncbi:MAG: hypothetical protein LC635_06355 [Pseudonocardiaceae bacterium]|nr:hypothetical protein [Pseudonocardiaceae bacterium]